MAGRRRRRMHNPLAVFAVVMGGFQLFFQLAEAQKLVEGRWWSLASVGVAAVVLTTNGYIHAYQQERDKLRQGQQGAQQQNQSQGDFRMSYPQQRPEWAAGPAQAMPIVPPTGSAPAPTRFGDRLARSVAEPG